MNNKLSTAYLILISAPFLFGCRGPVEEENKYITSANSVALGQKYIVDTKESVVTWKGSMLLTSEEHIGYVYISKGELMIEKGRLVGGKVEIDLNTIEYKDKENKNTPVNHLKSPDYFDVEKFPTSTIAITNVVAVSGTTIKITGNLTIKGITHPVTFPAEMEVKDGIVNANGKLIIDRTDWGIRYRSGKFYDILADQIVSDDIEFLMKIVAKQYKDSLAQAPLLKTEMSKERAAATFQNSSSPGHNVVHEFTYLVAMRDFCNQTLLQMRAGGDVNKKLSKELEGELLNSKTALTSSKFNGLKVELGLYEVFWKQIKDSIQGLSLK